MARNACSPDNGLDVEAVQGWLEYELAKLKLAAGRLVAAYFEEGRERSYSQKIWPRLKDYNGRSFYVIWCRKDYVNPKRGIVRTSHISRGQGSYRRRLSQVCRHLEDGEKGFVLGYEEKFQAVRQRAELLAAMLAQLERYRQLQEKEEKNIVFGDAGGGEIC
ncbi:MAG: conjugative transfer protein MobI(A/C) [Halothiobacillaceae bacterium]